MSEYALLKTLHLGALIFWLGPALGAWLILKSTKAEQNPNNPMAHSIARTFYLTIIIEHIAFITLLTSGFLLAQKLQYFGATWLTQKLAIIFIIIIPLEIVDILLGNWLAAKASKKLFTRIPLTPLETRCLSLYHGLFTKIALVLIPSSVIIVMILATGKSGIF